MMVTLFFNILGRYMSLSIISSLILSTQVCEAASISMMSIVVPLLMALQFSHTLQGLPSIVVRQFIALANNLALDVFPVHLGQKKR